MNEEQTDDPGNTGSPASNRDPVNGAGEARDNQNNAKQT